MKDLICWSVTDEEENSDDNLSLEEISSEEGSVIGEEEKKPSKKKDFWKKLWQAFFVVIFKYMHEEKYIKMNWTVIQINFSHPKNLNVKY